MNRKLLMAVLLLMFTAVGYAQKLTVSKSTIDCGKTGYQSPVTAIFELRNKGSKKLRITDVHPDCGCTQVEYPKGDIGAGDRFTIKLTYDARQLGHFYKQAAVVTNSSAKPLFLTMKGVVLADMRDYSADYPFAFGDLLADKNVLEFDDVNKGDRPQQEIHMLNNGSKMMTPNILHLPPYLSATSSPATLAPGRMGKVVITLNSAHLRDYGLTQTAVYLASQIGEKVRSESELPVSAVLLPDFRMLKGVNHQYAPVMSLSEPALNVLMEGKSKKSSEIVISNKGRTNLVISSLQLFTGGVRVTLGKRELQPGEQTKMRVTAYRNQLKKVRSKPRVLMITNDPDHAKVVIPINIK